jgi:hypothetical protein
VLSVVTWSVAFDVLEPTTMLLGKVQVGALP